MSPIRATIAAATVRRPHTARANIVFAVGLLLALALLWYLRDLLMLLYASALFAVVVHPFVDKVEASNLGQWRPSRGLAIATVAVLVVVLAALILMVLMPPLWGDANTLIVEWPRRSATVLSAMQRSPVLDHFDVTQLEVYFTQASGLALALGRELASGLASVFTVLLLTIYLVVDGDNAMGWCLRLLPGASRQRLSATLAHAARRMRGWLYGQATIALILGVSSGCVFALLHVRHAYALALAAALLSFVPILGPLTAAVLAGVVAAVDAWPKMAGVLIFFAIYQLFDNTYLTPRIMRNAVDVPGLAIILALAIGGSLGGILGAALSVPSAALVAELLHEYAVHE